jgi:hypothetical protein
MWLSSPSGDPTIAVGTFTIPGEDSHPSRSQARS